MTKSIENLFLYLVACFDLSIILLIFFYLSKLKPNKIVWLLVFYCCLNSITNWVSNSNPHNYYVIYVIFTFLEYLTFAAIITLLIKNRNFKKLVILLSVAFSVVVFIHYEAGKSQRIDSIPIGIETILIILYAFYYLYEEIK